MKEVLKHVRNLGEFNPEDFYKGYNPVGEAIDDYEIKNGLTSIEHDNIESYLERETIEDFLDKMAYVKKGDLDYETIYEIDYYGNGFVYSREEEDIFYPVWETWDGENLDGGKSGLWYYYFINRSIMKKYYSNNFFAERELCDIEAQTDCHILINDDSDYDDPKRDAGADFINEFWPAKP